jgi:hypothetical protein
VVTVCRYCVVYKIENREMGNRLAMQNVHVRSIFYYGFFRVCDRNHYCWLVWAALDSLHFLTGNLEIQIRARKKLLTSNNLRVIIDLPERDKT